MAHCSAPKSIWIGSQERYELSFLLSNSAHVKSHESEIHVARKWLSNLIIEMQPSIQFISLFFLLIYILLPWNTVIGSWKWSFLYKLFLKFLKSLVQWCLGVDKASAKPGFEIRKGENVSPLEGCNGLSMSLILFLALFVSGERIAGCVIGGGNSGMEEGKKLDI